MRFKDRAERVPIDEPVRLRQDRYEVEVRIRNVSTGGFMAHCSDPVRIGSHVSLDVPGIGPVDAQVRWQLGHQMGGQFVHPLGLAECEWTATRRRSASEAA